MPRRTPCATRSPAARSLVTRSLAVAAAVGLVAAVPSPAHAAPAAADDHYAVYAGGTYTLDPLDNDSTTVDLPPSTEPLTLCGLRGVERQKVYAEQSGDSIVLEVRDGFKGRTSLTYDVCQGDRRDTALVVLDVRRLTDLAAVKKRGVRGTVLFSNPNDVAVDVTYGSAASGRRDATRTVPAGRTIKVTTTRRSIFWVGLFRDRDALITVGDDTVEGLRSLR